MAAASRFGGFVLGVVAVVGCGRTEPSLDCRPDWNNLCFGSSERGGNGGTGTGGAPPAGTSGVGGTSPAGSGGKGGSAACDEDGDGVRSDRCGGPDCDDFDRNVPGPDHNAEPGTFEEFRIAVGRGASDVAVDSTGTVHYAYVAGGHVRHLVQEGRTHFRTEGVYFTSGSVDVKLAMAIDSDDRVHIAFGDRTTDLRHAVQRDGGWTVQVIEDRAEPVSLAVGPVADAHLAYFTWDFEGRATVSYAYITDAAASMQPLSTLVDGASIAVGPDGVATLAFTRLFESTITLGRKLDYWEVELVPVPAEGMLLLGPRALAMNASGNAALTVSVQGGVFQMESDGTGGWQTQRIPAPTPTGAPFLDFDPDGTAHLLFPIPGEQMAYMTGRLGRWSEATIPATGFAKGFALDASGAAHIAFERLNTVGTFHYATNRIVESDFVDSDCDGVDGIDADRDGFASAATGGPDCDDADPNRNPLALDPLGDGIDSDCDRIGGCPKALPGPSMTDVGFYDLVCIDSTEVTNVDYSRFLDTEPELSPGPPDGPYFCSVNDSALPASEGGIDWPCPAFDPVAEPYLPVVCIDWCDAWAYCAWAGKHLCGRIERAPSDDFPLTQTEWGQACSATGARIFPYGNFYEPGRCVDASIEPLGPRTVGSLSTCEGAYMGLFDMSGNVREWTDECRPADEDGSASLDSCMTRGGSFKDVDDALTCNMAALLRRGAFDGSVGFRCCASQ